jgi:hypothetical protein
MNYQAKLPKYLYRYTTLPFLLDLLLTKELVLLNPENWEDRNERATLRSYKEEVQASAIYVLCFTTTRETIHHWNSFAATTCGCRIEFNCQKLIESVKQVTANIDYGVMEYKSVQALDHFKTSKAKLCFTKRKAFDVEKEFRIVLNDNKSAQVNSKRIPIDLSCLKIVTITDRLPKETFQSIKTVIKSIPNQEHKFRISQADFFENSKWKHHFKMECAVK